MDQRFPGPGRAQTKSLSGVKIVKVRASVKRVCRNCKIIRRNGVVRVICKDPKHKQRQG